MLELGLVGTSVTFVGVSLIDINDAVEHNVGTSIKYVVLLQFDINDVVKHNVGINIKCLWVLL